MVHKLVIRLNFRDSSMSIIRKEIAATPDNYGHFSEKSETVVSDKVIRETKSWLKIDKPTPQEVAKKSKKIIKKPAFVSEKAQWLREKRDYSFLLSASGEVPNSDQKKKSEKSRPSTEMIVKKNGSGLTQGIKTINGSSEKITTISRPSKRTLETRETKKMGNPRLQDEGRKRKREKEDQTYNADVRNTIWSMFRYDPKMFRDDDGKDLKMEASFADIQKAERRSFKIARKEDNEELRKMGKR